MVVRQNGTNCQLTQTCTFNAESLPLDLEGTLGILRLDGTQTFFAIDGQHRVQGIKKALEKNDELKREEVSVIFVAHRKDQDGMERTAPSFFDAEQVCQTCQ